MRALIQTYRECPELGWGDFRVLQQPHREVLAHRCHWEGTSIVAVHNLSSQPVTTQFHLAPDDLVGDESVWLEDLFTHEVVETGPLGAVERALEGTATAGCACDEATGQGLRR